MAKTPATPQRDASVLDQCQAVLGYTFSKIELLRAALTHTSSANTRGASNERLEFLGDSILGLVTCEQLYHRFPEYQEGDLTKVKSVVVSRKTCAEFSKKLGLGDFLFLGRNAFGRDDVLPSNLLADAFESVVAAIYLDGGWETARQFVLKFVVPEIDLVAHDAINNNAKSLLQQLAQKEFGGTPRYYVLDEQGPDHDKCFKIAADVNGHFFPPAWGRNKKEAELKAAMNAIAEVNSQEIPYRC